MARNVCLSQETQPMFSCLLVQERKEGTKVNVKGLQEDIAFV